MIYIYDSYIQCLKKDWLIKLIRDDKVQVSDETIKCYLLTKGVSFHQKENIVNCRYEKG